MRIALIGAMGRMGQEVIRILPEYGNLTLAAAVEHKNHPKISTEVSCGVFLINDLHSALLKTDVILDFSLAETLPSLIEALKEQPKPTLICSTGHNESVLKDLQNLSKKIPIGLCSNTSLGIYCLQEISILAKKILGSDFDVTIHDLHHNLKKDAPSGTALSLASSIKKESADDQVISITSQRAGDVIGEHTVSYFGSSERIEITHRASSRSLFARGALKLLNIISSCQPGLYNASQLYSKAVKEINS
ncbi:MAG: 4-hydroxy-tetrahydrodipicolinate reductase [bacterium]|nr:4-hydroxy-tetrahydrodipicolinate reductase [bacterium]